jgi:hypothetical protein
MMLPVAVELVMSPATKPRRTANHREEVTVPSCSAVSPSATPSKTPILSYISQRSVIVIVSSGPTNTSMPVQQSGWQWR